MAAHSSFVNPSFDADASVVEQQHVDSYPLHFVARHTLVLAAAAAASAVASYAVAIISVFTHIHFVTTKKCLSIVITTMNTHS